MAESSSSHTYSQPILELTSEQTTLSLICIACGLDMTADPKVRRNLGSNSRGCKSEVPERVLRTWKGFVSAWHAQLSSIADDCLKMCRNCFNEYDKLSNKLADVGQRLQTALVRWGVIQVKSSEPETR